jgi:hypothetical protein
MMMKKSFSVKDSYLQKIGIFIEKQKQKVIIKTQVIQVKKENRYRDEH